MKFKLRSNHTNIDILQKFPTLSPHRFFSPQKAEQVGTCFAHLHLAPPCLKCVYICFFKISVYVASKHPCPWAREGIAPRPQQCGRMPSLKLPNGGVLGDGNAIHFQPRRPSVLLKSHLSPTRLLPAINGGGPSVFGVLGHFLLFCPPFEGPPPPSLALDPFFFS